jgi:CxxC motif-containing protein
MDEMKKMICINCPMGCRMEVTKDAKGEFVVTGNTCSRGTDYAVKELTAPTRVLTTTVIVNSNNYCRLPVRTKDGIPKDKIFEAMKVLNNITVNTPVLAGDIIVKDILGTGVDVIASRDIIETAC